MKPALDAGLAQLLADYQVHYHKLRGYHWTVTGPAFFTLHERFEELYDQAAEKVDALAERIAARGARPPVTLKEVLALARLKEDAGHPQALDMARAVATDLEALTASARALAAEAQAARDEASANLLTGFADEQEKTLWMLRAFLAQ